MNNLDTFLEQFKYVNRVVRSCQTVDQLENAMRWAEDWCKRMERIHPNIVKSYSELYGQVMEIN